MAYGHAPPVPRRGLLQLQAFPQIGRHGLFHEQVVAFLQRGERDGHVLPVLRGYEGRVRHARLRQQRLRAYVGLRGGKPEALHAVRAPHGIRLRNGGDPHFVGMEKRVTGIIPSAQAVAENNNRKGFAHRRSLPSVSFIKATL